SGGGGDPRDPGPVFLVAGADPQGMVDSRAAIQATIDAAAKAGGGTVRLPPGTYLLDSYLPGMHPWGFHNLLVPSGATLDAQPAATLLQGPNGRAPLPEGATSVGTGAVVFGTARYAEVTFQDPTINGGFFDVKPTQAGDKAITLTMSSDAKNFAVGDYV